MTSKIKVRPVGLCYSTFLIGHWEYHYELILTCPSLNDLLAQTNITHDTLGHVIKKFSAKSVIVSS